MEKRVKERVYKEANYIIKTNYTLRKLAKIFNVSKSTIHKDLKDRLKEIDNNLYRKVKIIFQNHLKTRHIKGGEATKKKYKKPHQQYPNKVRYDIIF